MRFLFAALLLLLPLTSLAGSIDWDRQDEPRFLLQWKYETPDVLPLGIVKDPRRPYLYVAAKKGGLILLDVSRREPVEAASIGPERFDGLDVTHITQQGRYLYLALGDFFDEKGQKAGIAIVDIRDPRNPVVTSVRDTSQKLHGASSILVNGDYAYLGAMEQGVFVFDVADKANITPAGSIPLNLNFPRPKPGKVQRPNVRGMALKGDTLFVAFDAGGLRAVDIYDRTKPREIGHYINMSLLRKQQAYNNIVIQGNYAYVAVDYCGMEVIDISNPRNMRQVGAFNPWHCEAPLSIWFNSAGHTNQIALDPYRPVAYLSAGDSELLAVDISDPSSPTLAASYGAPKDGFGTWSLGMSDDSLYLGYMKTFIPFRGTWAGIRALSKE